MDRVNRSVRAAWVVGLVSLVLFAAAAPARAAFPGANGLLVVQPARGKDLIVVGADGANPRQICGAGTRCHGAQDPVWSPDGSEIAFVSSKDTDGVIYPDGSCFGCPIPGPWPPDDPNALRETPDFGPGFLPDGGLAVSVAAYSPTSQPQLGAINTDGIGFQPFRVSSSWQQPAWSPTGQLAAVRLVKRKLEVFVIDPATGSARRLTGDGASSPTWSPDGRRLAAVHRGWIELIASRGGRPRRLTRGRAPVWSPDGSELAFVGVHNRMFVISLRDGRPRPVGHIHAQWVDWQPVTGQSPSRCQAPVGSSVLTASPDAVLSIDAAGGQFSVLGCLKSDGRERLLEAFGQGGPSAFPVVTTGAVAGDYAAVIDTLGNNGCCLASDTVSVFDLRTGTTVPQRGRETVSYYPEGGSGIDQLVLGADAVTAVHTRVSTDSCVPGPPVVCTTTTVEQILANDSTGTHILDSTTTTGPDTVAGEPLMLTQLSLAGDTVTWSHDGIPESVQLN